MVRRGWTQIEVLAGWTQMIRGRRLPSVQWPSARQDISKRSQSAVLKIQAPRQYPPKTDPLKSKITRFDAVLKAFGQEQSEAVRVWRKLSRRPRRRVFQSLKTPPGANRGVSCGSECENGSGGFIGSYGADDIAELWVLEDALAMVRGATPGRTREILRARGEALREGTGSSGRSVEGADSTGGRVGGGEPSFGSSPSREDFSRDQSGTANRPSLARGCSIEGSFASTSFWVRRRRDGVGASFEDRICVDVQFDGGGRQESSPRDRRWKRTICVVRMWYKSVRA